MEKGYFKLLHNLGIKYPRLVWMMYRHSLIHTQQPRTINCNGMQIKWAIGLNGDAHTYRFYNEGHIKIDFVTLYNRFIKFLDEQIEKCEGKIVYVEKTLHLKRKAKTEIKEIKKFYKVEGENT